MTRYPVILACLLLGLSQALGQTRLPLASITPGTEKVQLVNNGDFQFQGPLITNNHPFPTGWFRQADMFAASGTNMAAVNSGVVASAYVNGAAPVCLYQRTVNLEPNTTYVLSAYLWNMGDAANHVTTVIDMNDVPQEPQITLNYSDPNAALGYFVYRSFNTANTGPSVTLRIFYDAFVGTGADSAYFPIAAQWDNIAITRLTDFVPPQSSSTGGNLRPLVTITSPSDGTNILLETVPPVLPLTASASDLDGSIAKVEFYATATKLGETAAAPYVLNWTNPPSGSWQLTAVATDNSGATTVSAPVAVSIAAMPQPVALNISLAGSNCLVSWPASATPASLQSSATPFSGGPWKTLTNNPSGSSNLNTVTLPATNVQQYFRLGREVDAGTLNRKLLMGYQGWFACPQDGSPVNQWVHWFRNNSPTATNATVDFWPDISELDADELFSTSMTLSNGSPAKLYSAFKQKTVLRHFKWMKDNHLDGVFLQRFSSELSNPSFFALRNQIAANVRIGADTYGRAFAIMYDISGQPPATLVSTLTNDWAFLMNNLRLTDSPGYIRHKGKPVVAVWGFGFTDRPGTPQDAQIVINFFKSAGCTLIGGVPTYWRTLNNDSQTNPAWATVYRSFDIISPWSVGRYANLTQADSFKQNLIVPDLADTTSHGIEYMPVIFPGFSWHNLNAGPLNQIPRNGGSFYWRQVYNAISAGCTMLFGAMFDEMDEGTAMLKMAPTASELPAQGTFVPLNIDGQALPSDWYLRLADQAGKMLRAEIPLRAQIPITP